MIREEKGRYKKSDKGKEGMGRLPTLWKYQNERWWVISVFSSEAALGHFHCTVEISRYIYSLEYGFRVAIAVNGKVDVLDYASDFENWLFYASISQTTI